MIAKDSISIPIPTTGPRAPTSRGGVGVDGSRAEDSLPLATIRLAPEDFVVEEIPAYTPSGRGEHLFITFRKRGLTTTEAVRRIAEVLEVDPRSAGFAGMKDRHAITTQTASFAFPLARSAEAAAARLAVPGIEVLGAARHDHKLKPGHLAGNRFIILLRDIEEPQVEVVRAGLETLGRIGVPNAFGAQRFGRDGDNPARALDWLAGRARGPHDRREQRLLFSALQSLLFNRVLERRIAAESWASVLPGDIAKKRDTGGLFTVPLEGPELDSARARAEAGAISATGPMFGAKMRWPEGEPAAIEREILAASTLGEPGRLEGLQKFGEGTRRPLRLEVSELAISLLDVTRTNPEDRAVGSQELADRTLRRRGIVARFVLPKGGYATTVLGRTCRLVDAAASRPLDRVLDRVNDTVDREGRERGLTALEEDRQDEPSLPGPRLSHPEFPPSEEEDSS
jgi:tRNA pseudouridine13 synthase